MSSTPLSAKKLDSLRVMANRLRKHSLIATAAAGSGHPTTCFSCAELISVLFFRNFRFDVQRPELKANDRFVLSKGHAAPILWGAWAEAGAFSTDRIPTLRRIDSDLEGHPTPRNPWVDVATGSLGQGLSNALGMALVSRVDGLKNRIYCLLGDGEAAEGSVWEAAALASFHKTDNLTAILDVNRLGQSQPTMHGHDLDVYRRKFEAFGWFAQVIDGHDVKEIDEAFQKALAEKGRPSILIAKTFKGKGVSFVEDKDNYHGKPITGDDVQKALAEIGENLELPESLSVAAPDTTGLVHVDDHFEYPAPTYKEGDSVATRKAYGTGLKKLGDVCPLVVVLDGDVKNSTHAEDFQAAHPDRFFESFIAEQNMVGMAAGMSALGKIPFSSTFACFLTRAYDFIRMGAISHSHMKLCGSHAGVSIGEDGPSQMGLEDIAMMRAVEGSTVLYPSDAVSTERMVELAAHVDGIVYIRTTRPKTPILYANDEPFEVGGSKVLRSSPKDAVTVVGAGITLHEALNACETLKQAGIAIRVIDLYSVKPIDTETLKKAAKETKGIITVEDHYPEGGIGEAVLSALAGTPCRTRTLAVTGLPRSGKPEELLYRFGISAKSIVEAVKEMVTR